MATPEERIRVLKMIQEGKISAEEGLKLLDALAQGETPAGIPPAPAPRPARFLRIRVTDLDSGIARINLRMPVGVVQAGMKMGARFSTEIDGHMIDQEKLLALVRSGETGIILDTVDEKDGEHVEIFLE